MYVTRDGIAKNFLGTTSKQLQFSCKSDFQPRDWKKGTPFETWYGYRRSLSFLKVLGYLCFLAVLQVKIDEKAISGIFLGYSSVSES